MGGSSISTGLMTNKGTKQLELDSYFNKEIESLTIHIIPLSLDDNFRKMQTIGIVIKTFIPMIFNPSLTHIALQLNLKDCDDIFIIEYGHYLTEHSNLKKSLFSSGSSSSSMSSNSSKNPKTNINSNIYYYINKDGARITKIKNEDLDDYYRKDVEALSKGVSNFIACQYYNLSYYEFQEKNEKFFLYDYFYTVDCDVKNKLSIKELTKNFKGEKWEAKNYNFLTHNCQDFAVQVIKILDAVRKNEKDKVRMYEKTILPGCLISALWHNEDLSLDNTLGRIPIFGFFHDLPKINNKQYK